MLNVFRENLKHLKWALWMVIIVFVVSLFVGFGRTSPTGAFPSTVAATVGSDEISYGDFQRQYQRLVENAQSLYGQALTQEQANQIGLPLQALETLIAQQILVDEALRLGLEPSERELQEAILDDAVFQDEEGKFIGEERYKALLLANRLSTVEFENQMRKQLLLDRLNSFLSETVYVSLSEVEETYREETEKARIRYLLLPKGQLRDEISIVASELEEYFQTNQEKYQLPEQRVVSYLSVDLQSFRSTVEISEEEIQTYYDENVERFTQQEQVRARHILRFSSDEDSKETVRKELEGIRRQIEGGSDFATLARQHSEDEATKERGGELGYFGRRRMNPAFEDAAFGAAVGELVGPVETSLGNRIGYHLIEVLDKRPGGVQALDEVKERIRGVLINDVSQQRAQSKARELYDKLASGTATTSQDQLRALAVEEGAGFEVTEPFARDGNLPGIGRDTAFSVTTFQLQPEEAGEPVRIPSGWAVPVLQEIVAPRLPELSEVEEQARQDLTAELESKLANQRLDEIRQQLAAGKGFEEAATELGVPLEESEEFGHRGSIPALQSQAVVDNALTLEPGDIGGPIQTEGGVALFEVVERTKWDAAEFETNKEQTQRRLEDQRVNFLRLSLIEQRRLELEVHYSPQLVDTFELQQAAQL